VYENKVFETSINEQKFFLDTLKVIAYKAETALASLIKNKCPSPHKPVP
jgi:hypothetical protein